MNSVNQLSQKAVEYGKSFSKNLDYSYASLVDVEDILEFYHNDLKGNFVKNVFRKLKKEELTNDQIW